MLNVNKTEIKARENTTLSTLKKINNKLFLLEYKGDYNLDALLEEGVKDILGLTRFVQKQVSRPITLNTKPGDFACCSFNTLNEKDQPIMGRNFDYKESPCIVLWTNPDKGYRSMTTLTTNFMLYGVKYQRLDKTKRPLRLMAAPFVCMDGMNEKGLAIAILEIKAEPTKQSTGKKPIIPPIAVRGVLDKCRNIDEAVEFFSNYDMQDLIGVNYHYFLSDASGKSAIIEYVNNKMVVKKQTDTCHDLILTNHFLSEGGDNSKGRGVGRLNNINQSLIDCSHKMSEDEAMKVLGSNTLYYHHPKLPHMVNTVWSNVFNLEEKTQFTCVSMDYNTAYLFSLDKPCAYEEIHRSKEMAVLISGED